MDATIGAREETIVPLFAVHHIQTWEIEADSEGEAEDIGRDLVGDPDGEAWVSEELL